MGYSHRFELTRKPDQEQWANLILDVQKLFKTLPASQQLLDLGVDVEDDIVLCGPMGDKKPICTFRQIAFNGDNRNGRSCESFTLRPKKMSDFCKTDRKPYDFVVCAVLILAHHHLPDIVSIHSDGDSDEWNPSLVWVRQHLLADALLPTGIDYSHLHSQQPVFIDPLERGKTTGSILDKLKNISSDMGDFYFT